MRKFILLGCFFLLAHSLMAQKQNNIWCFGMGCGLNFNSGTPVAFTGCAMHQLEGCASIADSNGNLLFYTDGDTAWNKNNQVMPNGIGLGGNSSTTQSALIVNSLTNKNQYYVFTAEAFEGEYGGNGFNYSIIDMTLQGGMGDVTTKKNKHLLDNCDERIAATAIAGGTGIWVITTVANSAQIYAYRLTTAGLDTVPVITNTEITGGEYQGQLKISLDGSRIALANHAQEIDILDFDNATGITSNLIAINDINKYFNAYGVEFSPDGKRLYATMSTNAYLYQLDLAAGSSTDIINSSVKIFNSPNQLGSLQLATDGKIYVAHYFSSLIGVINNPNALGMLCSYGDTACDLILGKWCQFGLPNMYITQVASTGTQDIDSYTGAYLFPNPAEKMCIVRTATAVHNEPYIIFDITGRPVKEGSLDGTETSIPVDELARGIYMVQAGDKLKHVFKLVKE